MERKISDSFIKWLLCCVFLYLSVPLEAQDTYGSDRYRQRSKPKKEEQKEDEVRYPLFNGISVGVDLWGPGSKLMGGDVLNTEVSVDVDLKHLFFPSLEIGYGKADAWNDNGIHYKSSAPYFRIGVDYNALAKKKHGHMLLVGVRYGMSNPSYGVSSLSLADPIYGGSVHNPNLTDDIWGGSLPYDHQDMSGSMQWLEFCLGIRAHIWKALYMGWTIRMKYKLSASSDRYGDPWQVPGFGKYGSNTMGVTYSIIYKLPF